MYFDTFAFLLIWLKASCSLSFLFLQSFPFFLLPSPFQIENLWIIARPQNSHWSGGEQVSAHMGLSFGCCWNIQTIHLFCIKTLLRAANHIVMFFSSRKWKETDPPTCIHRAINDDKNNIIIVINDYSPILFFQAIDHLIVTSVSLCARKNASYGV